MLDRTQPTLPMTFSKTEKRAHNYIRNGTTNLFAALNTQTERSSEIVILSAVPRNLSRLWIKSSPRTRIKSSTLSSITFKVTPSTNGSPSTRRSLFILPRRAAPGSTKFSETIMRIRCARSLARWRLWASGGRC